MMHSIAAHRLAQYIEWQHAKQRAKLKRTRSNVDLEYDPLAATCLGDLILRIANDGKLTDPFIPASDRENDMNDNQACENTDREIWRGPDEGSGSYYADSVHITKDGGLGINVGGTVIVNPLRDWHGLAAAAAATETALLQLCINHGLATGHGDTAADIIREIDAQIPSTGSRK